MDLMSLVAKLTLNKDQYDKGLEEAVRDAEDLKLPTPKMPKVDNTQFDEGVKEAEGTGNWFSEVMTGVWQGVKDAIVSMGITSIIAGIIGYMKQGISLAIKNGKEISDNSKNLQISTKAYQEYEYALGRSNLKVNDLSKAIDNMGKIKSGYKDNFSEQQQKWLETLNELGLSLDETTDGETRLQQAMKALARYNGSDKGQIIDFLFGKNQNWTGFFDQTASEIEALKQEANDLGLIMSDESIENSVKFTETTEKLSEKLEAIQRSFGEGIVPILTAAVDSVLFIMSLFTGGKDNAFAERLKQTNKELYNEMANIEGTGDAAMEYVDKLYKMGDAEKLNAEQQKEWKETAAWLIEKIPELSTYIDADTGYIDANRAAIKANIDEWKALAKQRALQQALNEKEAEFQEQNADALDKEATARAAKFLVTEKQNAAIKAANDLLENNAELQARVGLTEIDRNGDVEAQLNGLEAALQETNWDQYEAMHELVTAYDSAVSEANKAEEEFKKVQKELEKNKEAYDAWVVAYKDMYAEQQQEADAARAKIDDYTETLNKIPRNVHTVLELERVETQPKSYAIGDSYIPYDQLAYVHRGEEIRTATAVRRGESGDIDYTELEDRIIEAIRVGMADANVTAIVTDSQVARGSNRYNGREIDSRRFRP